MAPKKNSIKAPTPDSNKSVKKLRREKPKPIILRVSIPVQSIEATNELKITKKQMTPQIKLDLANQVANAQLVKSKPVVSKTPEKPPLKNARGRTKKVISDYFKTNAENMIEPQESAAPKKRKIPQVEENSEVIPRPPVKKSTVPKKRLADSTVRKPVIKRQRVANEKPTNTNKPKPAATKHPPKVKITRPKRSLRNKPNATKGEVKTEIPSPIPDSPTLLDPNLIEHLLETNKDNNKITHKGMPAIVESRKTSMTSNSSLSWTKDISDSSTITCITVTSKDVVRIDKKLPVISVTDIKPQIMEEKSTSASSSSNSDSSSSSESTKSDHDHQDLDCDMNSQLNLSTSSLSVANDSSGDKEDQMKKIGDALDKLSAKLKHFDLEMVDWIGYENQPVNADLKSFQTKIFRVLKEEHEVIMHCQQLKKVLTEDTPVKRTEQSVITPEDCTFAKPNDVANIQNLREDEGTKRTNAVNNSPYETLNNVSGPKRHNSPNRQETYNARCNMSDQNDDDDALSLFAESITGFDSNQSKTSNNSNACVPNNFEEYVPEPIMKDPKKSNDTVVYCPTKIVRNDEQNNNRAICEKQSADSTSIKDLEYETGKNDNDFTSDHTFFPPSHQLVPHKNSYVANVTENREPPGLLAKRFEIPQGKRSTLFTSVCFFNLIRSCKNEKCRYPHVELDVREIKYKLHWMTEKSFIQEYMLLRSWPNLRRKYGMCFVEEARKRDLTRVLVEMALDFSAKATKLSEDLKLQVEVNELVLLHLNNIDLDICDDLLNLKAHRKVLSDIFMETIADTQNFSRFKNVFINLVNFISSNNRSFSITVTEQILERVCILPCEERLIRVMLVMIRNTDCSILQNSMIPKFEKHLMTLENTELIKEFRAYKEKQRILPVLVPYPSSPQMVNDVEPLAPVAVEREKRYTSPDTTNLDNMNKATVEPVITRTLNMNPLRLCSSLSPASESRPNNFQNWAKKFVRKNYVPRGGGPNHRHQFQPMPITRQVTLRHCRPNFPRRPGPNF